MNRIKELRAKLKKLNGLQWTKKQSLRRSVANHAALLRGIHRDSIKNNFGTTYVPWDYAKYLSAHNRTISELTKDMNQRRWKINQFESEIFQIKMSVSKDAYFEQSGKDTILGLHAVGFKDPEIGFFQEEIWANNYKKNEKGFLEMKGGSMRVHGDFDDVVKDIVEQGGIKVEGKLKT